jgi:hypothetical protein
VDGVASQNHCLAFGRFGRAEDDNRKVGDRATQQAPRGHSILGMVEQDVKGIRLRSAVVGMQLVLGWEILRWSSRVLVPGLRQGMPCLPGSA